MLQTFYETILGKQIERQIEYTTHQSTDIVCNFATKENKFFISVTQFNVHTNIINIHKHFSQDQDEDYQGFVGAR